MYDGETLIISAYHNSITADMFKGIEKIYIPLREVDKVRNVIEERCRDALFIEWYGGIGMGDASFKWLYILRSERVLFFVNGISFWGGDIGLSKPEFFELCNYDIWCTEKIAAELSKYLKENVTTQTVKKIITALEC
ncbi:MAG: hypothetical protein J1F63_09405 [Oscillospiraceae bacterium]|nr:hypothetical protein [Oscillospiraceae bacterium]